jgi:bifunctional non-homologous end joining protein LigD
LRTKRVPAQRPLETYRRMRDFGRTAEPPGGEPRRAGKGRLSFYIQRHAASRLHYDFRLELDGVLKSWAVPKGPSLDPSQRRLAVHVEDHPLEYGTFEGEIPRGEYGGGTVLLWDLGRWVPEGDPAEGYRKRRLKFRLEGRKLRGRWTLVGMGGKAGEDGKNWLLIKERDGEARAASEGDVTELLPESVSGRARREEAPAPLPRFVPPQLATLAASAPSGEDWVHELKFDGYRVIAAFGGGAVRLFTRKGLDWSDRFRPVLEALKGLSARSALLDGEVVVLDEQGRSDFQKLQNALSEGRGEGLLYHVFDLLSLDGQDLRGHPLLKRKAALQSLLESTRAERGEPFDLRVRYTEHVKGGGAGLYRKACELALEGVVCKRADAPYLSGERSRDWLKVKCLKEQEFVVAGFTEPGGSRKGLGALVLGVQEKGGLRYAGRVGTGFTQASLRELRPKLEALETPRSAFLRPPAGAQARGARWIKPVLVAEVAFTGWTSDGLVRQGSFKGLREDKAPEEVTVEEPAKPRRHGRAKAQAPAPAPRLSNPDRVLWPDAGVTKAQLAEYLESVSSRLLPQVARRPLALLRCPAGVGKPCFYQKHDAGMFPASVKRVKVREKKGGHAEYLYIEDEAGLRALAQMGALELHPWGSTVDDVDAPDRMIIDLDPAPGVPWERVVAAAREVRGRLRELGLGAFLKTTGGKGLHVVVPLAKGATWEQVKTFSRALAGAFALESPDTYTARLPLKERKGRIFIDYLRNERGSTAVAAWSPRARAGATVSMPLDWSELKASLDPRRFTVLTAPKRLAKADPWADLERARRPLPAIG